MTEPVMGEREAAIQARDEYTESVISHSLDRTRSGTKHEALRALDELVADRDALMARVASLEGALREYHDLAPALAECANECGAARLYSDLYQANQGATAVLYGVPDDEGGETL